MSDLDWSKIERVAIERIVEEGQAYLDGQIRLATSADQRASVLSGVFTAAGTAFIAGLIALGAVTTVTHPYPIYASGAVSAAMFLGAAALCVVSTMPVGLYLPGNQPKSWYSDIRRNRNYDESLAEEAENLQEKIDENRVEIGRNAKFFKWGAIIGLSSPLAGILVWLLTSSAYWFV